MGGENLFQICYEGDLTIEVCEALRYLSAEPNFDRSWQVLLPDDGNSEILVRELEQMIGGDARLLVARTYFSTSRDYLLVRHSTTPGADYRELHGGLSRLGTILELPFESTFIVDTPNRADVRMIGEVLAELCPDESVMVIGVSRDFAWTSGMSAGIVTGPRVKPEVGFQLVQEPPERA